MSSIKSFNLKYLKENIKKSKGLIVLLLIIVPLLTTLFTVLFINGKNTPNLATEIGINWVNLIGMYLIPLGISFALFGYVYKKNSVDLINSMPVNKQTIFVTNTIGGIILITLMQAITMLLLLICGLVCSNIVIFTKMIIDIFIKMWIGYVFIFVATNLAMTLSGTFLTQLVLTALILFLLPFTSMNFKGYLYETRYKIYTDALEKQCEYAYSKDTYTTPIQLPIEFALGNTFSGKTLLKSSLLGIIYIALGTILFKKRKMENNEESFKDPRMHLLVKALTVFPMIVFLNRIDPGEVLTIFILAIIAIYYFAYDFIVKRKIKLLASIGALILTVGVSYVAAVGMEKFENDIYEPSRKVHVNDIRKVAINLNPSSYDLKNYEIDNYFFDNEEIIKILINDMGQEYDFSTTEYDIDVDSQNVTTNKVRHSLKITYITKNSKELVGNITITDENFNKLIDILSKDEKYVEKVKKQYTNSGRIILDKKVLPKEVEEAVNLELKKVIDSMSLKEIYENVIQGGDSYCSDIGKVYYSNHKYYEEKFSIGISPEIAKIIIDYQNSLTANWLRKVAITKIDARIVGTLYLEESTKEYDYYYYRDTEFYNYKKDIVKFVQDNENVEVDSSKDFYQIYFYEYESRTSNMFYTNKIDEVNNILQRENSYKNGIDYKVY